MVDATRMETSGESGSARITGLAGDRSTFYGEGVSDNFREVPGLKVEVEKVVYVPDLDAPEERPHPYVYFLKIVNGSVETISIRGRKWMLRDDTGQLFVVEGQGVVGETPVLQPGESFSYNSYHVVARNSVASGTFFGMGQDGGGIRVSIPEFRLVVPESE